MKPEENILLKLQELAPTLATGSAQMPYSLPEGYFETFPLLMLDLVAPAPQNAVPEGYFNSFPELMLQKLRANEVADETAGIAPLLNSISKAMPNHVPADYFSKLKPSAAVQTTPVIAIRRKVWMRVAAAVVVLLAAFSIWQWSQNSSGQQEEEVASVPDTLTIPTDISIQLAMIEDGAIESAFRSTGQSIEASNSLYYLETDNFEEALKDISVDEISEHLEETPQLKKSI
ncbi:MAG TPA: hypothetical protein VLC98_14525 [Phnomibacter sp.]|nr:hypothetical protein [Phnomibacter sp.]